MKSLLLSVILTIVSATSGFAQFSLGAHVTPAFPLGDFANTTRTGVGFDVEGRYSINSSLIASAAIGFQTFAFEVNGISSASVSYNITPITFSLLYTFSETEFQPYLGLGLGINRVAYEFSGFNVSDSHFGLAPIFGLQYELNDQLRFDINVKYQLILISDAGSVASLNNNITYIPFNLGVFYTFGE